MDKAVCITGGAGFIGSHIVQSAIDNYSRVIVADDFSTGHRINLEPFEGDIEIQEVDIRNKSRMRDILSNVDEIFHQAAMPSVPRSMEQPVVSTDITFMGTLKLFQTAQEVGVERIVYASSSSVYGDQPELPKQESMDPMPESPYAAAKLSCEVFAEVYADKFSIDTIGLRYFNVFGPRQDPESDYAAVIPAFIRAFLGENCPEIYGDGEQSRDFTYVSDVVQANFCAMESGIPGKVYNVGYNDRMTVNELAQVIKDYTGASSEVNYEDPRPGDVRHSQADVSELKSDTGFSPNYTVREGLKETINWFRNHPDRWET
ncbi:MAG: NAD-dependent epimerase/dehydratase family protein [bacterium]